MMKRIMIMAALALTLSSCGGGRGGAEAAATRAKVLDCVRANGLVMAGMHLPEPGYIDFSDVKAAE